MSCATYIVAGAGMRAVRIAVRTTRVVIRADVVPATAITVKFT